MAYLFINLKKEIKHKIEIRCFILFSGKTPLEILIYICDTLFENFMRYFPVCACACAYVFYWAATSYTLLSHLILAANTFLFP